MWSRWSATGNERRGSAALKHIGVVDDIRQVVFAAGNHQVELLLGIAGDGSQIQGDTGPLLQLGEEGAGGDVGLVVGQPYACLAEDLQSGAALIGRHSLAVLCGAGRLAASIAAGVAAADHDPGGFGVSASAGRLRIITMARARTLLSLFFICSVCFS